MVKLFPPILCLLIQPPGSLQLATFVSDIKLRLANHFLFISFIIYQSNLHGCPTTKSDPVQLNNWIQICWRFLSLSLETVYRFATEGPLRTECTDLTDIEHITLDVPEKLFLDVSFICRTRKMGWSWRAGMEICVPRHFSPLPHHSFSWKALFLQ